MNPMQMKAKEDALDDFASEVLKPFFLGEYEGIGKGKEEPKATKAEMPKAAPEGSIEEILDLPMPKEAKKSRAPSMSIIDIAMSGPKEPAKPKAPAKKKKVTKKGRR